jgi:hypothetical protein
MTDVENTRKQHNLQSASPKQRAIDHGPDFLPDMAPFVALVRKVRRPLLIQSFLTSIAPEQALPRCRTMASKPAVLSPAERDRLFQMVATFDEITRSELTRCADLIMMLTDEFGAQAVQSLLDVDVEAEWLDARMDSSSRALYLYLRYAHPAEGTVPDTRFEQAEQLQALNRSWRSDKYSSHFKGPKDVIPCVTEMTVEALKRRILAFYPLLSSEDIQIEHYTPRNLASTGETPSGAVLHVMTAIFNGGRAHFRQVLKGDVIDRVEPAAIDISYTWDPKEGLLSVYSEDREHRLAFATAFRDEILARDGAFQAMPLWAFDLEAFRDGSILERIQKQRIPGISQIVIRALKVAKSEEQATIDARSGRPLHRQIQSPLTIGRDRHDVREVYEVARQAHGITSFLEYDPLKIDMTIHMTARPHRGAHRVPVQITAPNGLTDRCKTEEDRRQVMAQLSHLGIMRVL